MMFKKLLSCGTLAYFIPFQIQIQTASHVKLRGRSFRFLIDSDSLDLTKDKFSRQFKNMENKAQPHPKAELPSRKIPSGS